MGAILTIALKDLRLRIRDRSAFIVGIIAPLGLAVIFSFVLGDIGEGSLELRFGVYDGDGADTARQFVSVLNDIERQGVIDLTEYPTVSAAGAAVGSDVTAVFVLPAGLSAAISSGAPADIEVIGDVDSPTATSIAAAIAEGFAAEVRAVQLSVGSVIAVDPGAATRVAEIVDRAVGAAGPLTLGSIPAATRELDLTTFFVAGMAIFFLFFTVQFGVLALLEERTQGTLARLQAAPIRRSSIVLGKALVSVVLGLTSMAVLIVASTLMLGAEWGDPVGVALLSVCAVFSAVGIMGIVAAFARTAEGAGNLQSIIAVGLGMLGGIFFPAALGEGILARLSYISPHAWFMAGLADLAGGGGVSVITPSLIALVAFGVVTSAIAWLRLGRGLTA